MSIPRSMILNAAALAVSISSSYAGPCSPEIERMRACIDAKLAAGPSAPESVGAMMHRQPTRGSVAAAEERLAELSAQTIAAVAHAMRRARAADSAGARSACKRALADVKRAIGP